MPTIQLALIYALSYWFALTAVPGLVDRTSDFVYLVAAAIGFAILMFVVPYVLDFFKLPKKNLSANVLIGGILTLVYTYILKPGILGIISMPPSAVVGNVSDPTSFFRLELDEFGIILFITVVSVLIVNILEFDSR
jgi:hypothetical protein